MSPEEQAPPFLRLPHCYHKTGSGTSYGFGGKWDVVCCWCDKRSEQSWHIKSQVLFGHGRFYRKQIRVDVPIQDDSPCTGERS